MPQGVDDVARQCLGDRVHRDRLTPGSRSRRVEQGVLGDGRVAVDLLAFDQQQLVQGRAPAMEPEAIENVVLLVLQRALDLACEDGDERLEDRVAR